MAGLGSRPESGERAARGAFLSGDRARGDRRLPPAVHHRSFTATPALRVMLAIAGSMSFEGDVIGWVAVHRRHHAFTDRPGDPHSPYRYGTSLSGQLRGLAHAHVGWLLRDDPTPAARYAPDMAADPAMRAISAAFPALCAVSLGLPFAAGWAIGGSWRAALTALLWAGLVRVTVLRARHLERQLPVPRDRCPSLYHPPLRPRHQLVAAGAAVPRRELAQHCTIPIRPAPGTAPTPGRSMSPPPSSASWSAWAGRPACTGPSLLGWKITAASAAGPGHARPSRCRRTRSAADTRPCRTG